MEVVAVSSPLRGKKLDEVLVGFNAVAVDPSCVQSMEELELAEHLARKAFKGGKNIAKKMKYEFLLWLTGKTDLQSAFRNAKPKSGEMILVVFSGDKKGILEKLEARTENWKLETSGDPLMLERISLSRIRS